MAPKKEEELFAGHLRDLAQKSCQNNIYTFTHFLDEAHLSLLMSMTGELSYAGVTLFGGTEHADRCMARFGKEEDFGYSQPFPISCLCIEPLSEKFGQELTHRDVLGALMSLGVKRDVLGDIYVHDKKAYVFCQDHFAGFITENLCRIRRTSVSVAVLKNISEVTGPRLESRIITAASERLDAVISRVYNLSRSQSQSLFVQGKVYINGKQTSNSSLACRAGDKASVRGYGKFIFDGTEGLTGKGRCRCRVRIYQ